MQQLAEFAGDHGMSAGPLKTLMKGVLLVPQGERNTSVQKTRLSLRHSAPGLLRDYTEKKQVCVEKSRSWTLRFCSTLYCTSSSSYVRRDQVQSHIYLGLGFGWVTPECFPGSFNVLLENKPPPKLNKIVLQHLSMFSSFHSTFTSLPGLSAEKHPHTMMLPPPCFTEGMVCFIYV